MTIPGFIFDNDGVLVDSCELHWLAWNAFSQEFNLPIKYSTFLEGFGKRNDTFLINIAPTSRPEERIEWAERKEEIFRTLAKGKVHLLPGMEQFLKTLKKENYDRIIASSGSTENLKMFLSSTLLGKYFHDFVSGEQVCHGKPAPDIFQQAALRLGRLPRECIVLEDSPAGLEAGMSAGCFVIALATTHSSDTLTNYHMIVDSPKDLDLDAILHSFKKWYET